jgi:diguanylate cyclase (GGDEF)-like protein
VKNSEQEHFIDLGNYVTTHTSKSISDWIQEQVKLASFIAEDSRMIAACADPLDAEKRLAATLFVEHLHSKFTEQENIGAVIHSEQMMITSSTGEKILVNPDTIFIDSVNGETLGKRNEFIPHSTDFANGTPFFVSSTYPSILRGNPIIVISVPVKLEGKINGYVFLSPQINSFTNKFLNKAFSNASGYLFIADDRGLIVAHNNSEYVLNQNFAEVSNTNYIKDQILTGNNHVKSSLNDEDKQYFAQEITLSEGKMQQRLFAIFTQNENQIFRNTSRIFALMIFILIISIIALLIITYSSVKKSHLRIKEKNLIHLNETLTVEVKKRTQELQELAEHDSLTACLNHDTICQNLKTMIHKASKDNSSLSIAMLDLDDFKHVNDQYGHTIGDNVLRIASQIIKDCIRNNDYLGRYGGEEFLLLMPETNLEHAKIIAERIRVQISKLTFEPGNFQITVSIGICSHKSETALEMINIADQYLYQAKHNGKNRVEF